MLIKHLILPAFLFIHFTLSLNAQSDFGVEPEMFEELLMSEEPFSDNYLISSSLKNAGNSDLELNWKLVDKNVPEEWKISVADTRIEYFPGIEESVNPFLVTGLETDGFFGIFINSMGMNECGSFSIEFLDAVSGDVLITVPYNIAINNEECFTVSANEIEIPRIETLPNPTRNYVNISNSEQIVSVIIFSVAGDLIFENRHFTGNRIDLDQLQSGIYIMKLIDINKNTHIIKQVKI